MRKAIVHPSPQSQEPVAGPWLDLEQLATVSLTSEDPARPIESALGSDSGNGWMAATPGRHAISLAFDEPRDVQQIYLRFESNEGRTQEFVLEASTDGGQTYRELVRQQFNFSPDTTVEQESYFPELKGATHLTLTIVPDTSGGEARATLRALRLR